MFTDPSKCTGHGGLPLCSPGTVYPASLDSGVMTALHTQPLHLPFCFYHYFFSNYHRAITSFLPASSWNKLTLIPTRLMRRLEGIHSDLELPPHLSHLQTAGAIGYAFCRTVRADNKEQEPSQPLLGGCWRWCCLLLDSSKHWN